MVIVTLADRVLGRTAAEDIVNPETDEVIIKNGDLIEEHHSELINQAELQEVRIRSVLTCETTTGVCAKCYGRDLARGTPVNIGEAVGVIAAQSIGEPGTQLTMRTFHIGGAAQVSDTSIMESNYNGTVSIKNRMVVKDAQGNLVAMGRSMAVAILDQTGKELASVRASRRITHGVAVSPDSRFAFISIEGVGADPGTVDVIDLQSFETVASIDVGKQASGIDFWKME